LRRPNKLETTVLKKEADFEQKHFPATWGKSRAGVSST
jgi:hypothetical protein